VYPDLRWELTLHLGNTLVDDFGNPLFQLDTLIRLARLPWFRLGYMPDWLRWILISSFTPAEEQRTRRALKQLLSTAYQGNDFELIVSPQSPDSLVSRAKSWLFSTLYRKSPIAENLKDEIFIDFVLFPRSRKLSVAVSDTLRTAALANTSSELDDQATTADSELLQRYEPVLRFAKSERFFPMAVEPYLEKCKIFPSGPQGVVRLVSRGNEPLTTRIGKLESGDYYLRFVNDPLITSDIWIWWALASALLTSTAWFIASWQGVQVAGWLVLLSAFLIFIQASPIRLRFFPAALTALLFLALEVAPLWFFLGSFPTVQIEYLVLFPIYFFGLFYLSVRTMKFIVDSTMPQAPVVVLDMFSRATETVARKSFEQYSEILQNHPQPVYYGRVARWQDVEGNDWKSLQYHYFYAFSDWRIAANGTSQHEGDWEMVSVYLKNDQPYSLLHSQQGTGAMELWSDLRYAKDKNGQETSHPLIFVALGSHANYTKPEVIRSAVLFNRGVFQRLIYWIDGFIHFLFLLFSPSEKERAIALQELATRPVIALSEATFERLRTEKDHYLVSLPLEVATGDGLRIGSEGDAESEIIGHSSSYLQRAQSNRPVTHPQERNWKQVLLSPEPDWVRYQGLWGVKSSLKEDSGSPGPKWDQSEKTVRDQSAQALGKLLGIAGGTGK
jgi:hypothetical protein